MNSKEYVLKLYDKWEKTNRYKDWLTFEVSLLKYFIEEIKSAFKDSAHKKERLEELRLFMFDFERKMKMN